MAREALGRVLEAVGRGVGLLVDEEGRVGMREPGGGEDGKEDEQRGQLLPRSSRRRSRLG